jgi:hypothetical protein
MKQSRMHPAAPGYKTYQKLKCCNLTPSMKSNGMLTAVHTAKFVGLIMLEIDRYLFQTTKKQKYLGGE